jgi:dihydrofolate synthase/folylpolyglutamate synthase
MKCGAVFSICARAAFVHVSSFSNFMSIVSTTAVSDVFTDYADVQDYLFSLKARGVKFGIDRMRSWSSALGHPELATPLIHITGTNGKGSTAAMLDAIFREAGWRAGLYTSPHLVLLGERVQVNRARLTEAEILDYTNQLRPVAGAVSRKNPDDHPSFFEFMTAMAFMQFARKKCDIGIIETGMGGRLDATNVISPELSVITTVSPDHCEFLGDTVEKIAFEKAGIIKPGKPVVLGHLPAEAEAVIRRVAVGMGSRVHSIAEEFGAGMMAAGYPETNLEGDYQRWNAATATLVARVLMRRAGGNGMRDNGTRNATAKNWCLTDGVIARGLQRVDWPGRWQRVVVGGQELIFDASHNPEGARVLDDNLTHLRARLGGGESGKPIIVTCALGEQRARALLEVGARHARELHLVVPHQSRACSHEELEALVPRDFTGKVFHATVGELFPEPDRCALSDARAPIIVTGSIYLIGEVFTRLQKGVKGEGRLQDF